MSDYRQQKKQIILALLVNSQVFAFIYDGTHSIRETAVNNKSCQETMLKLDALNVFDVYTLNF